MVQRGSHPAPGCERHRLARLSGLSQGTATGWCCDGVCSTSSRSVEKRVSLFSAASAHEPLRVATITKHIRVVRMAVAALPATGTPMSEINSLAVLVQPDAASRILDWHWLRAGSQVSANTGHIAATLCVLAEHVGLPPSSMAEIRAIARKAKPKKRSRMTEKNERRLAQLNEEVAFAKTMHLGEHLMRLARAAKARGDTLSAAWLASTATAVTILLRCPLRMETLHALRLGSKLTTLGNGKGIYSHLLVKGHRTENNQPVRWRLHAATIRVLKEFLDDFRPLLPTSSGPFLFPGRDHPDQSRAPGGSRALQQGRSRESDRQSRAAHRQALGHQLMQPDLVAAFITAFNAELKLLSAGMAASGDQARRELKVVRTKIANLVDAISDGRQSSTITAKLNELEKLEATMAAQAAATPMTPVALHPSIADVYKQRVGALQDALAQPENRDGLDAARALIDRVVVFPPRTDGEPPGIEVVGELIELLKAGGLAPTTIT